MAGQLRLGVGDQPHPHHAGVPQAIAEPIDQAREVLRAGARLPLGKHLLLPQFQRRGGGGGQADRIDRAGQLQRLEPHLQQLDEVVRPGRGAKQADGHLQRFARGAFQEAFQSHGAAACPGEHGCQAADEVFQRGFDRFSPGGGKLGRPAHLELRRRIPGRQRFGKPARHAVQAIQQLRPKARRKLAPRQGFQLLDPPDAQAMQQCDDRLRQAEGFQGKGEEREGGRRKAEAGETSSDTSAFRLLPSAFPPYQANAHAAPGVRATAARSCQPSACNTPTIRWTSAASPPNKWTTFVISSSTLWGKTSGSIPTRGVNCLHCAATVLRTSTCTVRGTNRGETTDSRNVPPFADFRVHPPSGLDFQS